MGQGCLWPRTRTGQEASPSPGPVFCQQELWHTCGWERPVADVGPGEALLGWSDGQFTACLPLRTGPWALSFQASWMVPGPDRLQDLPYSVGRARFAWPKPHATPLPSMGAAGKSCSLPPAPVAVRALLGEEV